MNARLKRFLDAARVEYDVLPHGEAFTSQEIAASAHVSGHHLAKVVMLRNEAGRFLMAVLPAASRLDLEELARIAGAKRLSLTSEPEFRPLFDDCETGAMPPFGNLYGIEVFADESFARVPFIVFQAGNHHEAVRMRHTDYERLVKPRTGDFAFPWIGAGDGQLSTGTSAGTDEGAAAGSRGSTMTPDETP